MTEKPTGMRFSQVYIDHGKPSDDSKRMRHRLASVIDKFGNDYSISEVAERKLGIETPWSTNAGWRQLLAKWDIKDVLDLITIAYGAIEQELEKRSGRYGHGMSERPLVEFIREIQAIFTEENVHYGIDNRGGVHYKYDKEFARSKAATIAVLQMARYVNVLDAFNRSMEELAKAAPDGKHAIRSVFAAAEGLFRMIVDAPRLTNNEAQKLKPLIQKQTNGNPAATGASLKALESFKQWIDAAHFYRHEPGTPDEVAQPPLPLALHLVSTGAANIRWLTELDPAV